MMMWPQNLIKEIARRKVVFFLGSGVSATARTSAGESPKSWIDFLKEAALKIPNQESKEYINKIIEQGKYLLALQAIVKNLDPADYSNFLDENFNKKFEPSNIHKYIHLLDSNIVITTNFDKIYENYCENISHKGYQEGYKTISYYEADGLSELLRSETRIIIKAHGSINNSNKIIFTKSQYYNAKKNHPNFYKLLQAIFLTHTCIFIGCSLDDPDIILSLEDVNITSCASRPHYALVRTGSQTSYVLTDWLESYNIKALEYGTSHNDLEIVLENLFGEVEKIRSENIQ